MTDHVLRLKDRNVRTPVMNVKSEANEIWSYHRSARPRLDRLLRLYLDSLIDLVD